jgi:hypothetical protein
MAKTFSPRKKEGFMGSSVFLNNKVLPNFNLEMWPSISMPKR